MYLYTEGQWSKSSSTLDHAATDRELYQLLATLGFRQHQELLHRAGVARLYVRENTPTKGKYPIAFDFCCVLYLGHFLYTVGLKSLQDVFSFVKEIDAHPKETPAVMIANINEVQQSLTDLADRLEDPRVTIRQLSALQSTLDQLTTALSSAGTFFQQGLSPHSIQNLDSMHNGAASPLPAEQDALVEPNAALELSRRYPDKHMQKGETHASSPAE